MDVQDSVTEKRRLWLEASDAQPRSLEVELTQYPTGVRCLEVVIRAQGQRFRSLARVSAYLSRSVQEALGRPPVEIQKVFLESGAPPVFGLAIGGTWIGISAAEASAFEELGVPVETIGRL